MSPHHLFQLLSDPTRLRCLVLLHTEGELCVCELTHALGMVQPKISRHLALLREAEVVEDRRQGQWVHYRIHPLLSHWARQVIAAAAAADPSSAGDRARLATMEGRPERLCCPT